MLSFRWNILILCINADTMDTCHSSCTLRAAGKGEKLKESIQLFIMRSTIVLSVLLIVLLTCDVVFSAQCLTFYRGRNQKGQTAGNHCKGFLTKNCFSVASGALSMSKANKVKVFRGNNCTGKSRVFSTNDRCRSNLSICGMDKNKIKSFQFVWKAAAWFFFFGLWLEDFKPSFFLDKIKMEYWTHPCKKRVLLVSFVPLSLEFVEGMCEIVPDYSLNIMWKEICRWSVWRSNLVSV